LLDRSPTVLGPPDRSRLIAAATVSNSFLLILQAQVYRQRARSGPALPRTDLPPAPVWLIDVAPPPCWTEEVRLNYGITVPPLIVNGLDHVGTRHSVQRLWPETLIDMAAGALTTQVIVKPAASNALCLLHALDIPFGELEWAERLALETGLSPERIRDQPVTEITKADIVTAGTAHSAQLEKSRGELICGRVTEQNLTLEDDNPDFAPAVPFVTAFSGVVGAAESLKRLMGMSSALHYQRHFQSNRSRALRMLCDAECGCHEWHGNQAWDRIG
jgi:hypothetical protein